MSVKEDLIAMREWLTPPGRWCQNYAWRDKNGHYCQERKDVASACLYGAFLITANIELKKHEKLIGTSRYEDLVSTLSARCEASQYTPHPFVAWQDAEGRTHEEILALLDRCIADCDTPKLVWPDDFVEKVNEPERELELA